MRTGTRRPAKIRWYRNLPEGLRQLKTGPDAGSFRLRLDRGPHGKDERLGWDYEIAYAEWRRRTEPGMDRLNPPDPTMQLGAYAQAVINERSDLAESSRRLYQTLLDWLLAPHPIAELRLVHLQPRALQAWLDDVARMTTKGTRRTGPKRVSPATVSSARGMLAMVLAHATDAHYLRHNPMRGVKLPKAHKPPRRIVPPTPHELRLLLDHLQRIDDRLACLYTLAMYTGMRRGELLALSWDDVDWGEGEWARPPTVHVSHTLDDVTRERTVPKTESSVRSLRLTPSALMALRAWRQRWEADRAAAGHDWHNPHALMFVTRAGRPISSRQLLHHLARAAERSGLNASRRLRTPDALRFHDFRHAFATMALRHHSLQDVSKMLGHASIRTTADLYHHQEESARESIMDYMETTLGGDKLPA